MDLLADENTRGSLLAGGTDLIVQWESGVLRAPERVISIKGLPELEGIREVEGCIHVGALVTHAELRRSALVRQHLPALAAAAATVGGPQIQALGTIAGNVANASPAGDLAPALLITDGSVVVAGVDGERAVKLTDFFLRYREIDLGPKELIVRFELPKRTNAQAEAFRKLGPRAAQAISKVMAAHRATVQGGMVQSCALAIGSVAPTVVRLPGFESWIVGKPLTEETFRAAEKKVAGEVRPIDDIRSTGEYRKWVSGRIVRGFLQDLAESR